MIWTRAYELTERRMIWKTLEVNFRQNAERNSWDQRYTGKMGQIRLKRFIWKVVVMRNSLSKNYFWY